MVNVNYIEEKAARLGKEAIEAEFILSYEENANRLGAIKHSLSNLYIIRRKHNYEMRFGSSGIYLKTIMSPEMFSIIEAIVYVEIDKKIEEYETELKQYIAGGK